MVGHLPYTVAMKKTALRAVPKPDHVAQLIRSDIQLCLKDQEIVNLKIGILLDRLRIAEGASTDATLDQARLTFVEPAAKAAEE